MFSSIIDLTRIIRHKDPGVSIVSAKSIPQDAWNAHNLTIYSHAGTHMDAPKHFNANNTTIDTIPVETFIGKAWVVDIDINNNNQLITIDDLKPIINVFKSKDSILLRTGWSQNFGTAGYRDNLPRISEKLALWMVENQVKMLGVEPPSVADVNNIPEVTLIHEILLRGNVQIIEGLVNLEKINSPNVTLIALPLKIENGDGAPARVIAGIL